MLCQAPVNWRSEKFPVGCTDKILLLQTATTRKDWAGGLKPHFCSISFGNPISQLTNHRCSRLVPGMWHYPYVRTGKTLTACVLLSNLALPSWKITCPHFQMRRKHFFFFPKEALNHSLLQVWRSLRPLKSEWSIQYSIRICTSIPTAGQSPLLLDELE